MGEPTAEPVYPLCLFGHDVFTAGGYCRRCGRSMLAESAPPSIEDMVPVTTFTATLAPSATQWVAEPHTRRFFATLGYTYDDRGLDWDVDAIDPSTIRDVRTP